MIALLWRARTARGHYHGGAIAVAAALCCVAAAATGLVKQMRVYLSKRVETSARGASRPLRRSAQIELCIELIKCLNECEPQLAPLIECVFVAQVSFRTVNHRQTISQIVEPVAGQ